jgi:glycosyltransferase involved in cell wall biosynthesis
MEIMTFDLTKLLAPMGEVFLVCRSGTFIEKKAKDYHVTSPVLGIDFRGNFSLKFIREFKKIVEDHKIKNVVFLGASELKSIYFACKNKNINVVNFHGTTKTHSKKDFLHKIIYKIVNTHVSVSDHIQKNVKEIIPFSSHTKIRTIYTPKEVGYKLKPKPKGPYNCLLVGRVTYGKGHADALEACEYATQQGLDVNLKFVGNIQDQEIYNSLQKKLSHSNMKGKCTFEGHHSNVAPFYEAAHFLLFPSLGEGLPGVLLEAFQYGVMPLTYDNTVFPEFLKMGFNFSQVPNKSVPDLQKALVEAIKNYPHSESAILENYNLANKLFSLNRIQEDYISILN